MYALAYYNLAYIAFHKKDYATAQDRFLKFIQLRKAGDATVLADAYNRVGDCYAGPPLRRSQTVLYRAENLGTPAGDYSYYQLALVSGLQKDYDGKITLLNRLADKYPNSPYAVSALFTKKGRSYVQGRNNSQAIATFRELLNKYPESPRQS